MSKFITVLTILVSMTLSSKAWCNDVSRQFSTDQYQEVLVGDTTTYALRISSKKPLSWGLTTLFVSPGQGQLVLQSALQLANSLAEKGWHVNVVTPHWFSLSNEEQPANVESDIFSWQSQMDPAINFDELKQQTSLLLAGLANVSQDVNGFNLYIAEGMIATLLLADSQINTSTPPNAATYIAPFWPTADINNQLPSITANYPVPLLDISYASSNRFAQSHQHNRAVQANVEVKLQYRQRLFPRTQSRFAMAWISGEIIGWTRSLGW